MNKKWLKERDAVAKSYDVEKFKTFIKKWTLLGVYDRNHKIPSDKVIEITMRKMVYHMNSASPAEKAEAKAWLLAHGCTTDI